MLPDPDDDGPDTDEWTEDEAEAGPATERVRQADIDRAIREAFEAVE